MIWDGTTALATLGILFATGATAYFGWRTAVATEKGLKRPDPVIDIKTEMPDQNPEIHGTIRNTTGFGIRILKFKVSGGGRTPVRATTSQHHDETAEGSLLDFDTEWHMSAGDLDEFTIECETEESSASTHLAIDYQFSDDRSKTRTLIVKV